MNDLTCYNRDTKESEKGIVSQLKEKDDQRENQRKYHGDCLEDQERFHQAKGILSDVQLNFVTHIGYTLAARRLNMACRCFWSGHCFWPAYCFQ